MKKRQVTIIDLAKALNISTSTVSRALSNHPDISIKTKRAVMELAEQWDYQPNLFAQNLVKNKSNNLGVIVPELVNPFFVMIINGIQEYAMTKGYNVLISQSYESKDLENKYIENMLSSRVEGLLIAVSRETEECTYFDKLIKRDIPVVCFNRVTNQNNVSKVLVDDCEGAFEVTEHLISRGCSNIVFLNGPSHLQICQKRLEGYRLALMQNNISPLSENVMYGGLTTEESLQYSTRLFEPDSLPDAVFAINDQVAVGAIKALKNRGVKIPDEIMVAGFSDQPYSSLIEPSLTSLEHPTHEIGKEACKLIIDQIEKEEITPKTIILKGKLVIRDSTRKNKKPVH